MGSSVPAHLPILDLALADDPAQRPALLGQLREALFDVGFLYIKSHGVASSTISHLTSRLPALFDLPTDIKADLSKLNSPHFLGYSGFAEETTLGQKDLREQFDFATELPVVYKPAEGRRNSAASSNSNAGSSRDFSQLYWRLRGPNQWPPEALLPGFRQALETYHDALQALSYRFVHLVEEAFGIPVGTFDQFFRSDNRSISDDPRLVSDKPTTTRLTYLPPQHRIKLLKYPPNSTNCGQGVGPHKDSSGWLTFLLQIGREAGLEVLAADGETWISAPPIDDTFVVNFGNAFEAATEGAVKATVHRVTAPPPSSPARYSIPFFQGLPLDMTVSEIRSYMPLSVRTLPKSSGKTDATTRPKPADTVSSFLDARWDALGESQLRKWIRSHEDVGRRWYGDDVVRYYAG
ncbi:uncharacterized protein J3D65DRAFT_545351 [Phyllosticta citribraziliensis]|uniref:Fe2OG dioxygenase domain-containing protein n=1 Tax=Phyllosticta citribraziliensis TaxID=989973 RepID=A0ABR1MBP9_9PEZI